MAKVSLPERGQPLDVSYIYTLAQAINDLAKDVSAPSLNFTSVDVKTTGTQERVKTAGAKVVGKIYTAFSKLIVTSGQEKEFTVSLGDSFKFPPVVTATPVNIGGNAGNNVTVVITSVSQANVSGTIRFNSGGEVSVDIHIIAIGIPNSI